MVKKYWMLSASIIFAGFMIFGAAKFYFDKSTAIRIEKEEAKEQPIIRFGLNINDFNVLEHEVGRGELFTEIFTKYNVTYSAINYFIAESKQFLNLRNIKAGNNFTVLCEKNDSVVVPRKLIYHENKVDFIVFNLDDSLYIYRGQRKVERKHKEVSGVITSSLYETLAQNDMDPFLAIRMSEIFAWSVDFYRIQNGDRFKIIYDEDLVAGESVGIGNIEAIVFESGNSSNYAFYYSKDETHEGDYYDENGNSMKKMFLKAPVKFSRISSRYTQNRFHPVTRRWKAHLGTDYAAPYGTPILATADGVVEEARFKAYNGNYVKIRHNGQYKTQYLHMSKIAKNIHSGVRVKQGDVIGYVGSTGLATGPHVCYRFWKDGTQVDPLRQKLSYADPIPSKYKADYLKQITSVKSKLDAISYEEHNISNAVAEKTEAIDTAVNLWKKYF